MATATAPQEVALRQATTCDTATYTRVEDRPTVKERTTYVLQHHPIEKQYVVETRFVGERELPNKQPDELMNVSERIVKTTEASDICDGAKGSAAAVAADASGSSNGPTGEPVGTIAEEVIVEEVVIPAAAPT